MMLVPSLNTSLPQPRHEYRWTSVSECDFDERAYFFVYWVHQILQKRMMVRCGSPLILFRVLVSKNLLLSSAHFLQEGKERHKAIIISRVKELLHESLGLFLGKLLTKVGEETEEFILKHSVVLIFVIKLQNFNEVMESTLVLGVFASLVHGEDISLGEHLLSLLGLTSNLLDGLEGWVQVASADEISGIEGINFAVSLEVIDIEGKFDGIDFLFLKTKLSHFRLFIPLCSLTTIEGEDRTEW